MADKRVTGSPSTVIGRAWGWKVARGQLSRIDPTVSNTCPSCGCINQDTSHVVRCPSPGRTTFYNEPDEDLSLHNIRCMLDAIDYYLSAQLQEEDLAWPSGKKSCWFTDNRTIICAKWPMTRIYIDYFHILQINLCLCCLTSASIR